MSVCYWNKLSDNLINRFTYGASYGALWGVATGLTDMVYHKKQVPPLLNILQDTKEKAIIYGIAGGIAQIGVDHIGKVIYNIQNKDYSD